jgi:hypothetical protein
MCRGGSAASSLGEGASLCPDAVTVHGGQFAGEHARLAYQCSNSSACALEQLTLHIIMCRSILPTENAGASEVYVDQIEVVSCTIGVSGDLIMAACQGTLQMKSYLSHDGLSAMLKMNSFHCAELSSQFPFMQGGASMHCFLEDLQLHQEAQLQPTSMREVLLTSAASRRLF